MANIQPSSNSFPDPGSGINVKFIQLTIQFDIDLDELVRDVISLRSIKESAKRVRQDIERMNGLGIFEKDDMAKLGCYKKTLEICEATDSKLKDLIEFAKSQKKAKFVEQYMFFQMEIDVLKKGIEGQIEHVEEEMKRKQEASESSALLWAVGIGLFSAWLIVRMIWNAFASLFGN